MDLRECYAILGGDYDEVMSRLRSEDRVTRFVGLFPADENFRLLTDALAASDWAVAFRAAHSLKGVALNLSFSALARSSSELTEALRAGAPTQDPAPLYQAVKDDYDRTLAAVQALTGSPS